MDLLYFHIKLFENLHNTIFVYQVFQGACNIHSLDNVIYFQCLVLLQK